jgi:hypothetical protein
MERGLGQTLSTGKGCMGLRPRLLEGPARRLLFKCRALEDNSLPALAAHSDPSLAGAEQHAAGRDYGCSNVHSGGAACSPMTAQSSQSDSSS